MTLDAGYSILTEVCVKVGRIYLEKMNNISVEAFFLIEWETIRSAMEISPYLYEMLATKLATGLFHNRYIKNNWKFW